MTLILGIHHVLLAVPHNGEAEARSFFGKSLGLQELPKLEIMAGRGGVWFSAGDVQLHLGIDASSRPAIKAHVAFQVSGITALRNRLIAAGYSVTADASLPGFKRYYVDDPFGNRVEILEPIRD